MEIIVGIYKVIQRTDYSKIQIFDKNTNENLSDTHEDIAKKIISDYKKQKLHPENYFIIQNDKLIELNYDSDIKDMDFAFVPDNIKTIAGGAFSSSHFKEILLPSGLTHIEHSAFANCKNLEHISLPDSVVNTIRETFYGCTNLKSVQLSNSLEHIDAHMFANCTSLESVYIPDSVLTVGAFAFNSCKSLKRIRLSENLHILWNGSFCDCKNLEKINLPDSLEEICSCCFEKCRSLKEMIVPDNVCIVGNRAFLNCTNLEFIKLPHDLKQIYGNTFMNCKNVKDLILPDSIEIINENAFAGIGKLENINIPKNIKIMGAGTFVCGNINSLAINYDLKKLNILSTHSCDLVCLPQDVDILGGSSIDKLIINNSVKKITPDLLGNCGKQISKIDYLGTEEEFKKFKKENKPFFKLLTNLKEVNFLDNKIKDDIRENGR